MPKFIVWVLIVPFSWFFVQFLLSISAILTVWVLTLPYDSFGNKDLFVQAMENKEFGGKKICKDVIISFNQNFWDEDTSQLWEEASDLDENIKCKWEDDSGKVTIKELITWLDEWGNPSADAAGLQNSIFGVISIYSYGILAIDELDTINQSQLETVTSIADLIFKIVFDVLFIVVYLLLMIALLLALFVRWVRLWIYMMLSPAFWLLYFFWKWSDWIWDTWEKFNIKEFISLALVPVYVSAALAFGLVFIMVAAEWIKVNSDEPDTLKAWGFSLTLIWAHGEKSDDGTQDGTIIGKLIVEIFWVVILWIAVMAALWASKTTKAIVEPIAAFGKQVWDLAAKAPTYAPIIPTWAGWMQSAASLKTIGWNFTAAAQSAQTDRAKNFMDGTWLSWDSSNLSAVADKIKQNLDNNVVSDRWAVDELRKLFKQWIKVDWMIWNTNVHEAVKSAATKVWVKPEEIEKFDLRSRQGFANAIAIIDHHAENNWKWNLLEWHNNKSSWTLTYSALDKYIEQWWNGTVDSDTTTPNLQTTTTANINNVSVQLSGKTLTAGEAVKQLGKDTKSELSTELDRKWVTPEHKSAILEAFDNIDSNNNGSIDWEEG